MSHTIPVSYCPDCGCEIDACTSIKGEHGPSPGDISICFNCTSFLQFDDNLHLTTLPTTKDLPKEVSDMLFKSRRAIHQMRKEQKP